MKETYHATRRAKLPLDCSKGVIGLQLHSYDELKLRFKDIRIKEH